MALTVIDYAVFVHLRQRGLLPHVPAVLELGEANWYAEAQLNVLTEGIQEYVTDPERRVWLLRRLQRGIKDDYFAFHVAKVFYDAFLELEELTSVDFQGSPSAECHDLNQPLPLPLDYYDIVLNLGTGEHIFNVYQFFKTVHDACIRGGLMLHHMPVRGWLNHGFYNFQPTLYDDLAAANGYTILFLAYTELNPPHITMLASPDAVLNHLQREDLGRDGMLYVVLRKERAGEFRVPLQGYYAGTLSKEASQAWQKLRG